MDDGEFYEAEIVPLRDRGVELVYGLLAGTTDEYENIHQVFEEIVFKAMSRSAVATEERIEATSLRIMELGIQAEDTFDRVITRLRNEGEESMAAYLVKLAGLLNKVEALKRGGTAFIEYVAWLRTGNIPKE